MRVYSILRTICHLPLILAAGQIAAASDGATSDIGTHVSNISWSGRQFKGRQYPSIEELSRISLKDLVAIRPNKLSNEKERAHFNHLFASHPTITRLDLRTMPKEEVIKEWARIWTYGRTDRNSKLLPYIIRMHLKNDPSITEDIMKEILDQCQKMKNAIAQRKYRESMGASDDPIKQKKWEIYQRRRDNSNAIRFGENARWMQNAERFQDMLAQYGISSSLRPEVIEEKSRVFRDKSGGVQRMSLCLRQYFKFKCKSKADRERAHRAMMNRRAYNAQTKWLTNNEKRKKTSNTLNDDFNSDEESQLAQRLVQLSQWWT